MFPLWLSDKPVINIAALQRMTPGGLRGVLRETWQWWEEILALMWHRYEIINSSLRSLQKARDDTSGFMLLSLAALQCGITLHRTEWNEKVCTPAMRWQHSTERFKCRILNEDHRSIPLNANTRGPVQKSLYILAFGRCFHPKQLTTLLLRCAYPRDHVLWAANAVL